MAESPTTATIATCAVGDVTCDQRVDAADALFMLQYDVKLRSNSAQLPLPANTLYGYSCDISGEGQCNQVDALLALQCSVGIGNLFCPSEDQTDVTGAGISATPATFIIGAAEAGTQIKLCLCGSTQRQRVGSFSASLRYDPTQIQELRCDTTQQSALIWLCAT
ncbi:MAG: hypothetical protein R2932_07905 [Caldilineaceae bacterium]